MPRILTKKRIKRYLGKGTFQKATDYHEQGLLSLYRSESFGEEIRLFAQFYDEGRDFSVELQLNSRRFVTSASCGCGCDPPCSHQGALLLNFLDSADPPVRDEPLLRSAKISNIYRGYGEHADFRLSDSSSLVPYRDVALKISWETLKMENDRIGFSPVFRFSRPEPEQQVYRNLSLSTDPVTGAPGFYLDEKKRLWTVEGVGRDLIKVMEKQEADISHISGVRRRAERLPAVEVDFPYNSYTLESAEPSPILNIEEFPEGISLTISWKTEKVEIPFHVSGQLHCREGKKGNLLLTSIPDEWRSKVFRRIRNTVKSDLIRESDRAGSFHFTAGISLDDYVALYGLDLLKDGYTLRKHGKAIRFSRGAGITVKLGREEDWFELEVGESNNGRFRKLSFSDEDILSGLLKSGDEYIVLDKRTVERIKRLKSLGMDERGTLKVHPWNPLLWKVLYDGVAIDGDGATEELQKIRAAVGALENFSGIREQREAPEFRGSLRAYQRAGLSWLLFLRDNGLSGCLADDMGLGKTVQALAFLQKSKIQGIFGTVLIVAPVSTLPNWESEISAFTPDLSCRRHHGPDRGDVSVVLEAHDAPDIILTSYATLRNDIDDFASASFGFLILDEAQAFKNPASQTFRAVKQVRARHRFALTGTPLENNLLELWSQFDVLLPGLLGTRNRFITAYCKPLQEEPGDGDNQTVFRLKAIIRPFVLRRTKKLVAPELPEKEEILLYTEMEPDQENLYLKIREHYQSRLRNLMENDLPWKRSVDFLEGLLRLRQAAILPSLMSDEYSQISSCKFTLLREKVEEIVAEGNKVIIFSQFTGALKIIRDFVRKLDCGHLYLDGQTKNREGIIRSFQEDAEQQIFLVSLKAGGVGINLTAADYVIIYDPWWNPAVERQAVDRAHRIGRTERVIAYRFIVRNTVEEKILKLQERKRKLSEEIVTEESSFFKSLKKEELEYLFS